MSVRTWPRFIVSGAVILITAGVVVFVGRNAAEGDPAPPTLPPGEYPSVPFTMSAKDWAAERENWQEQERSEFLNATPYAPTFVTIRGQRIDLPDGMSVSRQSLASGDGGFWDMLYFGDGSSGGVRSELWIDAKDGTITWIKILPEHEALFDPFVKAAGGWPTPSPLPTPIVVQLGSHTILVPDGMWYDPPSPRNPYGAAVFAYVEPAHVSRIYVDETGHIVKQEIFPDHVDEFAALIEEFSSGD